MERKEFERMAPELRGRLVAQMRRLTGSTDEADDIAQDTLLRLWQMRERLDDYSSIHSLASVIARNLAFDRMRRPGTTPLDDAPEPVAQESADTEVQTNETRRRIDHILSHMAPQQEAVMRMRHIEGLETHEIAALLGTTENNVRVLLCRARAKVKSLFIER